MNSSEKIAMYEATAAAIERGDRLPPLPEPVSSMTLAAWGPKPDLFTADQMVEYAAMAIRMSHTWPVLKADARENGEAFGFVLRDKESGDVFADTFCIGEPQEDETDDLEWMPLYLATQPAQAPEKDNG